MRKNIHDKQVSQDGAKRIRIHNSNVKLAERLEYWNELTNSTRYGQKGMPQIFADRSFAADYTACWVSEAGVVAGKMDPGSFLVDRQRADNIENSRVQLVLSGRRNSRIETRNGTYDIEPGSLYLQFHNEPRRIIWRKSDQQLFVDVDSSRLTVNGAVLRRAMFSPLPVDSEMVTLFVQSATKILNSRRCAVDAAGPFLVSLVDLMVRSAFGHDLTLEETGPARREQALAVMRDNLCRPDFSAEDLAAALNISRRSVFQLFDEGTPPMTVLRHMRIARAQEILSDPRWDDLTIEQVSRRCGFGTTRGFTNAFFRVSGQRPRDYRRNRGALASTKP